MQQEPDETTENDFSEMSDTQIRQRPQSKNAAASPKKGQVDVQQEKKKLLPNLERNIPIMIKNNNFIVRTIWTIVMILGFIFIIWLGHFYLSILILLVNLGIFKEITNLKRNYEKEVKVPYFSLMSWYFFFTFIFFCYGKLFSSKITNFVHSSEIFSNLLEYHNILSFMLWTIGFLIFTLSLKKGYYRYQFRMFGWTHITLILIVAQSSVITMNIYEGIVWFILPCSLVIINDIFAYIFGVSIGKTKLIELSPKKTWEGFIGGCVTTLFASFILAYYLQQVQFLICPQMDIQLSLLTPLTCNTPAVFVSLERILPFSIFGYKSVFFSQFQLHAMAFSLFTSLVAPFGGFFASGFKRGIKIKDFGDTIPGHGGITDRMDCQILTGMFSYLYLHQVILSKQVSAGVIIGYIMQLSKENQLSIYNHLAQLLNPQ